MIGAVVLLFALPVSATGVDAAQTPQPTDIAPADAPVVSEQVVKPPLPKGYTKVRKAWLTVAVHESLVHWVKPIVEASVAFRQELAGRLGQPVLDNVEVRLANDWRAMRELAPPNAPYPEYAEGVAYSRLGLILLTDVSQNPGAAHDIIETLRHELAHVALYDAAAGHGVPLWFNEGLAIHLSREGTFARSQALWSAGLSGDLIPLRKLRRRFPSDSVGVSLAYAQSADVVRFLLRTEDEQRFKLLLKRTRRGQPFTEAMYNSFGYDPETLEHEWKEDLDRRLTLWPLLLSGGLFGALSCLLIFVAWRRKRIKQTRVMKRWAVEEAAEDARARERHNAAALAAWLAARGVGLLRGPRGSDPPPVPKVEHEGDWHTLH